MASGIVSIILVNRTTKVWWKNGEIRSKNVIRQKLTEYAIWHYQPTGSLLTRLAMTIITKVTENNGEYVWMYILEIEKRLLVTDRRNVVIDINECCLFSISFEMLILCKNFVDMAQIQLTLFFCTFISMENAMKLWVVLAPCIDCFGVWPHENCFICFDFFLFVALTKQSNTHQRTNRSKLSY